MLTVKQKDGIKFGTRREGPRLQQVALREVSIVHSWQDSFRTVPVSAPLLFNQNDLSTRCCPVAHVLDPLRKPSPHTTLSMRSPGAAAGFPPSVGMDQSPLGHLVCVSS